MLQPSCSDSTIDPGRARRRAIAHFGVAAVALAASVAALALAAGLSGCGGVVDAPQEAALPRAETPAAAVVAPLFDDDGAPAFGDARGRPLDAAAWTRDGRYASAAQARQLAQALGDDGLLDVEVGCCGIEAVDQAVGIAWGLQAAHDLPSRTPVLVRGADLRLAAAAANRLSNGGLSMVWLVTP